MVVYEEKLYLMIFELVDRCKELISLIEDPCPYGINTTVAEAKATVTRAEKLL